MKSARGVIIRGKGPASFGYRVTIKPDDGEEIMVPVTELSLRMKPEGLIECKMTVLVSELDAEGVNATAYFERFPPTILSWNWWRDGWRRLRAVRPRL